MRRAVRAKDQRELIARLRDVPNMVLRTTFISGFPGETEEEFLELKEWIEEVEFDRVGVFAYSPEENTRAFDMDNHVPHEVAVRRRDELMATQVDISRRKNESLIGRELDVIVDGVSKEHEFVLEGRHYGQALDIDGVTYLSFEDGVGAVTPGDMIRVEIEDASEYDVVGRVL
jgi:ribosomal protein S12 methylthiotransferase